MWVCGGVAAMKLVLIKICATLFSFPIDKVAILIETADQPGRGDIVGVCTPLGAS